MTANPFARKSIFLWQRPQAAGGNINAIADLLKLAGFEMVIFKVADGGYKFTAKNSSGNWEANLTLSMVRALKSRGIAVTGYGFIYGNNVYAEADRAIAESLALELDGYVFDVESHFESKPDRESLAHVLMSRYRKAVPSLPAAFCSWAWFNSPRSGGQWHPTDFAKAFMQYCDYGMPMVYWSSDLTEAAKAGVRNSLLQWRNLFPGKPIVPAGRAYIGDGGSPTPEAVLAFEQEARVNKAAGVTWWSMQHALQMMGIWEALTMTNGFLPIVTDPDPVPVSPKKVNLTDWTAAITAWAKSQGYDGPEYEGSDG